MNILDMNILDMNNLEEIKQIGVGGFGTTFLVKSGDQFFVSKVLHKSDRGQFHKEADALRLLGKHEQVPSFVGFTDDPPTIIQQYIPGETLADIANTRLMSPTEVVKVLKSILPVIDFLHKHEFIHRDIKPSNIIWRDEVAYLVDFGAGRKMDESPLTKTSLGSPQYVSNEQLNGHPEYRSDLYSLACTCAHLLTGVSPWDLRDCDGDFDFNNVAEVPINLSELLNGMGQVFAKKRPSSALDCIAIMENWGKPQI